MAEGEADPRDARLVAERLALLRGRCAVDPVLREAMVPFEAALFRVEGDAVVSRVDGRFCAISAGEIRLGRDDHSLTKRIPL